MPRFGWHQDKPPQLWRFELSPSDFEDIRTLELKPEIIERMADSLIRNDCSKPGFVFIPNLHQFTSSIEAAWKFQLELVRSIYEYAAAILGLEDIKYRIGDVVIVDRDKKGEVGRRAGKGTYSLHWDGGSDQFISFMYHSHNLKGGWPMVGDAIQCLVDKKAKRVFQRLQESDPRQVLRAEWLLGKDTDRTQPGSIAPQKANLFTKLKKCLAAKLGLFGNNKHPLDKYQFVIQDSVFDGNAFPIVIINNRRFDGVAHTGTPVAKIDPTQPAARVLRQVFVQTELIPDQRIFLVGPPPNDLDKTLLPESVRRRFNGLPPDSMEHRY